MTRLNSCRARFIPRHAGSIFQPLESRRMFSAGDLDLTFAGDGTTVVDLPGITNEIANATVVQDDGKVILAGRATVSAETDFVVARLLTNGSIDTSFGGGDGVITIDFAVNDEAMDVAIDGSGRIVVVGTSSSGAGSNARNFAVARLTSAGALDTTFSTDGKLTIDFGTNDDAQAVAVLGNLIYVGGYKDIGTTGQFALARLNSAGALDTTYSGDGMVNFAYGGNNDSRSYDIAVDSSGRVVMVGYDDNLSAAGHTRNLAIARLGTNALLDPTFNNDGLLAIDVNFDDELRAVAIDFKGRIAAGGFAEGVVGGDDFAAVRVLGNGTIDTSFNGDGKFTVDLGNADHCEDLALQPDGTITLSGSTLGSGFQAAVVQLQPFTGLLSTSFGDGGDGIQLVDFGSLDQGFAMAVTGDYRTVIAGTDGAGRIAVGRLRDLLDGNYDSPNASASFPYDRLLPLADGKMLALAGSTVRRLLPNGNSDPAFTTIATGTTRLIDVAVDNAGRIVVAGRDTGGGGALVVVVKRFSTNGAVDTSFGGGDGSMSFSYRSETIGSEVSAIAIDSSNRIVIAGVDDADGFNEDDVAVARVTASGILDNSFHGDGVNVLTLSTNFDKTGDVAIQPDGKIVVVGNAEFDAFALRLNADGSRDSSFAGINGLHEFGFGVNTYAEAHAIVFDSAGRLVIGGHVDATIGDNLRGFVVRLETNGSFDSTFADNGKLELQFSPHGEEVRGITLDSSGNIVTAGIVRYDPNFTDDRVIVRKLFGSGNSGVFTFAGDGAWVAPFAPVNRQFPRPLPVVAGGAIYVGGDAEILRLNVDPSVVDFTFHFDTAPQRLQVKFNDDVGDSLTDFDLLIRNTTTNAQLNVGTYPLTSYDPQTNTATFNFNGILADGRYTATFSNTGIENRQEMALAGDRVQEFFFLAGDFNHDGVVNLTDFNILAANFGQSNRTFSQGDANYDGVVNLADFNVVAGKFGTSLAPAGARVPTALFSSRRLADELPDLA